MTTTEKNKMKAFAEQVSDEIMDAYEDLFDSKSADIDQENYTPEEMYEYLSAYIDKGDSVTDFIEDYDWESYTSELGLFYIKQ
tara:strand:- start:72 stop:320 length:249 start_codon:yes stop_codon:yes gene_type:complete